MSQTGRDEPLLPPWAAAVAVRLGPLVVLAVLYWLLSSVLHIAPKIFTPTIAVLALACLIYFGGRYYKPFYASKEKRCTAVGAKQRSGCRHFIPGARLGGGCGRLREDGRCRHVG